jgi:hypothetical protein
MNACGIWHSRRGLVAVIVDATGRVRIRAAIPDSTPDARWGLVQRLAATHIDLVVDEAVLPADPIASMAMKAGVTVWVAGAPLLPSLRLAAGITRGPPRATAALLARLLNIPWLRAHLRRLGARDDSRQIRLL